MFSVPLKKFNFKVVKIVEYVLFMLSKFDRYEQYLRCTSTVIQSRKETPNIIIDRDGTENKKTLKIR